MPENHCILNGSGAHPQVELTTLNVCYRCDTFSKGIDKGFRHQLQLMKLYPLKLKFVLPLLVTHLQSGGQLEKMQHNWRRRRQVRNFECAAVRGEKVKTFYISLYSAKCKVTTALGNGGCLII